jgi:phage major head subunit gpT-like protein
MGGSVLDNNPGLLDTYNRQLRTSFETALQEGVDESWKQIAMMVPGSSRKSIQKFITDMPGMKLWLGNRETDGWSIDALEMESKPYEATIEVDEFDLADDQVGQYAPIASQMGLVAARMPSEIVYGHLAAGFTINSYDSTTFFSDSHSFGDNKTTSALDAAPLEAGVLFLQTVKTASGQVMGLNRRIKLVVPPALRATAIELVGNRFLTDGTNNPNFGVAEVVVADSLADANNWYLIGENGNLRPIMFQEWMAPRTRMSEAQKFDKHKIFWGVDAHWGVAFALPQMAYGGLVT